jgi:small redox-active disulfide protein 2
MRLEILGTGCAKCKLLTERTEEAAKAAGLPFELVKITEIQEILATGVSSTPALRVDGRIAVQGHVPTVTALTDLLTTGKP